jgi:hypothetical protein
MEINAIEAMIGKVFRKVTGQQDDGEMIFIAEDEEYFKFYHEQSCCESVYIAELVGSLEDLVGSPILQAEVASSSEDSDWGVREWTFYKFATAKGYVTVRWLGESNGYYSTSVDLEHRRPDELHLAGD